MSNTTLLGESFVISHVMNYELQILLKWLHYNVGVFQAAFRVVVSR